MNLTQNQLHQIFEARLETPKARTWKQVSALLDISPSRLRKARRTREYLDCAYAWCLRYGYGTVFGLEQVGCLHPDTESCQEDQWDAPSLSMPTEFCRFDDGGRSGFDGKPRAKDVNDCVPRAIAIALERDYGEVYNAMVTAQEQLRPDWIVDEVGTTAAAYRPYLEEAGWQWLDLRADRWLGVDICKLIRHPSERIIVSLTGHFFACIGGVAHDVWDARGGTVRGIWVSAAMMPVIRLRCIRHRIAIKKHGKHVEESDKVLQRRFKKRFDMHFQKVGRITEL